MIMVQLIVAGMPRCGKTTSMHELLKEGLTELPPGETIDNIGERDSRGFSFYELVALAKDENAPGIEWVASTKHTSYTYCILSGMLCSREKSFDELIFKSPSDDSEKGLRGFQEDVLDNHFNEVYSRLHYLTKVHIPRSNIEMQQLKLGISIVNIWDIGISASLLHMLPQLIGYLDHSFPMLALSLERDPDHMAERFTINDFESEQNLEVIKMHRLRENYIFRFSHMAKTNFQQQKNRKACKIIFLTKNEITEEVRKRAAELMKTKILPKAKQYNVASLIDEIPILCNNQSKQSILTLRAAIEMMVLNNKSDVYHDVPISWMFLRSAVYASGKMFMKTDELKELAQQCHINEEQFYAFLRVFTGMGSLIYAPSMEALKKYVILNPFDFFKKLNELFCPYFNGDLRFGLVTSFSLCRIFSVGDDLKFFQALLKSCHFAVELNTSRFLYNATTKYPTCEDCYYIPSIRKQYYKIKSNLKHSLVMLRNQGFPPGDIPSMIVNTLLFHDYKEEVCIMASEYFNVTKFFYKKGSLTFSLISHGEADELRFDTETAINHEFMTFLVKVLRRAMLKVQRILGARGDEIVQSFSEVFVVPCMKNIDDDKPVYEDVHFLHDYAGDCYTCGTKNQWITVR